MCVEVRGEGGSGSDDDGWKRCEVGGDDWDGMKREEIE